MTETATVEHASAIVPGSPKKSKASGVGKKKSSASLGKKPSHPPTAKMVVTAVTALKERGGSSVQAIKKYITSTYKTDAEKLAPFIKKYLKSAVASGALLQTKGKGASGSFKLSKASGGGGGAVVSARGKKATTDKASPVKKIKVGSAKKTTPKKKPQAAPKAKKTTKTPPTKPKAPKVKRTPGKGSAPTVVKKVTAGKAGATKRAPSKK